METVYLKKAKEQRMQVAELKILRWSLGLNKINRIKNERIKKGACGGLEMEVERKTRSK